ncbi:hypothetical protein [Pedobacter frigidisoli]|uniref:hypothetical protein n=1 Tax=Pedobacter frigidisoli TaxID=2530455 RepID=UPI002931B853|nr:hypothetical protein [Pedobacter frigidisoli]
MRKKYPVIKIYHGIPKEIMNNLAKLETLGREFIGTVRDNSIDEYLSIKRGDMKSADAQNTFKAYTTIDKQFQDKIDQVVLNIIDRVLHNALSMFEQSTDFTICEKEEIDPNLDIVEFSDGLSGELYSEDGWIKQYSKYPQNTKQV